jgi:hypothetical protein
MIPVAQLMNSLSKTYAPVISFLIIAPIVSPITLLLTYGVLGFYMTIFRVLGAFLFALVVAYTVDILFKKKEKNKLKMVF